MHKICYIMGKSASGKDAVYRKLQELLPEYRGITLYTTRPKRAGEMEGRDYHFVDETKLQQLGEAGKVIELRAYNTRCGIWKYFTVDDGEIDLQSFSYLTIGTLCSYQEMKAYFGEERVLPVYIEVEDGERLQRALKRERKQNSPQYAELCRRFLADSEDFSEENLYQAGISRRFENRDLEMCLQEIMQYIKEAEEGEH